MHVTSVFNSTVQLYSEAFKSAQGDLCPDTVQSKQNCRFPVYKG